MRFLLILILPFVGLLPLMAQGAQGTTPEDYDAIFASLATVVAVIPMIVGAIKGFFPKMPSLMKQVISWVVAIGIAMFGWWQQEGFFCDMEWWVALLYGLGAGLAANGIADIGFVDWIIGLFRKKKE